MAGGENAVAPLGAGTRLMRHQARRGAQLALAVGGVGGGLLLLASNLAAFFLAGVAPTSAVPLLANAALVFGGAMFAREFRRSGREPRDASEQRPDAYPRTAGVTGGDGSRHRRGG